MKVREVQVYTELGQKMAKAGKAGTYESWMFEESDLIQHSLWKGFLRKIDCRQIRPGSPVHPIQDLLRVPCHHH